MSPSAVFNGIKPYHALMTLVFAVALAAGWTMLPGEEERIAMLERDGHSRHALDILEASYASGDRSYRTLHHMLTLYEEQGEAVKAREVLEAMVAARPRDAALRSRLATFYRGIGDSEARLNALKAQIELRYGEAVCRDYISLLRLEGQTSEEFSAIQLCRQKGYRRADDLARLAGLAAVKGDSEQGASLLRSIDDVRRLRDPEERYQLVALLLEQGQPKEAARRVIRWIKASKDQVLAVGLIDQLARSKFPDSAIEVAKEAGESGDGISLTVGERLIEQSQPQVARLYLRGWLDNAQFENPDIVVRFIDAAVEIRDPALALAGARKFGLEKIPLAAARTLAAALGSAGARKDQEQVEAVIAKADAGAAAQGAPAAGVKAQSEQSAGAASGPIGAVESAAALPSQSKDTLDTWRHSLWAKLSDDARRRAIESGTPLPRHGMVGKHGQKGAGHTKVLKKTSKVLQSVKKLKSLKLKQKLVREGARAKSKKP